MVWHGRYDAGHDETKPESGTARARGQERQRQIKARPPPSASFSLKTVRCPSKVNRMRKTITRPAKPRKHHRVEKPCAKAGRHRRIHVISPATASEIRKTLGIGRTQVRNILRAIAAAGVDV